MSNGKERGKRHPWLAPLRRREIAALVAVIVAGPATVPAEYSPEPSIDPTPEAMPQVKLGWIARVEPN